jgi:ribosomal protein S18 acetylase RimI-like enzyme
MVLEKVTEKNIEYAIAVQNEIFPEEDGRKNYEEAVAGISGFEYYLVYEHGNCAGITGIYWYPDDHDNAWLGWFGIREQYRRNHLGSKVLKAFEQMASEKGYRNARLYTDAFNNDEAIAFYKANGYTSEPYENPEDPACLTYRVLIFSRSLTSEPIELWNSRNIHLSEQVIKQQPHKETTADSE